MSVDDNTTNHRKSRSNRAKNGSAKGNPSEPSQVDASSVIEIETSEPNNGDAMSTDTSVKTTSKPVEGELEDAKSGAIQLRQADSALSNRPVMDSGLQVLETISVAGLRPIAASNLQVYGTLLGNRPISASSLKVYTELPGHRPVFYSDVQYVHDQVLPGNRPIMVSDPKLLTGSMLPGNRPIAPNEIDDAPTLMGYID
jgi:hypothetical protein